MGYFSEGIVREIDDVRFSKRIFNYVNCVEEVTTKEKAIGDIIIEFKAHVIDYNNLKDIDTINNASFFDVYDLGNEFKQLFRAFKKCTDLSNEEISNNLRKYNTCKSISAHYVEFEFVISPSFLVDKG